MDQYIVQFFDHIFVSTIKYLQYKIFISTWSGNVLCFTFTLLGITTDKHSHRIASYLCIVIN